MRRPKIRVAALVAAVLALPGAGVAAGKPRSAAPGPGCDPARPAVAHHAAGAVLDRQPRGAPIPCMTFTGPTTDSAALGVTAAGTAFYAPIEYVDPNPVPAPAKIAMPTIVARSHDLGEHWDRVVAGSGDAPLPPHGGLTDWLSVDPETSRVWYATPSAPCGATLSWSDDEGATWDNLDNVGCPAQGANALIEGPAPAGGAEPTGYPHVVYYCANAGEVPLGDQSWLACHKSLDGGRSFHSTGGTPDKIPPRSECGEVVRETRVGTVGRDGDLYFPQDVCGKGTELRLAISRDEGVSWDYKPIFETEVQDLYPPALAADADNDLFLAWKGKGGLPYLTVSRDRGNSWSPPIEIGAPGVTQIRRLALTARGPGHISVSYLGTADGGTTFNAYITESRDALAARPVFWSGAVNDPATPVSLGSERGTFGDRIQFLNGMIGPDGTPWAAFHCARTELCPGRRVGVAGRLARAGKGRCAAPSDRLGRRCSARTRK
ncbi:MAG: sialidase family protein [Thermoleophilaceae bacterium]